MSVCFGFKFVTVGLTPNPHLNRTLVALEIRIAPVIPKIQCVVVTC